MLFRTLCSIELQGPCSRKLNLSRSEIIFFESMVHTISIDALFVYHYTVQEDKKQVIPGA
jgi:hypothetical protein